jgi:hypothetical protein
VRVSFCELFSGRIDPNLSHTHTFPLSIVPSITPPLHSLPPHMYNVGRTIGCSTPAFSEISRQCHMHAGLTVPNTVCSNPRCSEPATKFGRCVTHAPHNYANVLCAANNCTIGVKGNGASPASASSRVALCQLSSGTLGCSFSRPLILCGDDGDDARLVFQGVGTSPLSFPLPHHLPLRPPIVPPPSSPLRCQTTDQLFQSFLPPVLMSYLHRRKLVRQASICSLRTIHNRSDVCYKELQLLRTTARAVQEARRCTSMRRGRVHNQIGGTWAVLQARRHRSVQV